VTYKVIQWATGDVGREAVRGIHLHPALDLVAAWVHSEDKGGRDIGEVCGYEPLGVIATTDREAIMATDADCVSFMGPRDWAVDPLPTLEVILRLLRSGKNVVSAWYPMLVDPSTASTEIYDKLQAACEEGGSSFYTMGLDPGYGPLGLALTAINVTRRIDSIRTFQFFNNGLWAGGDIGVFFGFGQPDVDKVPILAPGVTTKYHSTTLHLIARALGWTIDEFVEEHEVFYADEDFTVPAAHVPKGTISGLRYAVKGMVDGEPRVVLEHVDLLRDEDFAPFAFDGNGYRVEIEGEPCLRLDMTFSDKPFGGPMETTADVYSAVGIGVAMAVVNAIPAVCDAEPGVLTILDMPFATNRR
jgi:4-hydroxy-tetrahydrodipicolinate reductase